MLGGVFISYRREDAGGYAISDRLTSCLGRDNVFFDVDAIPPGRDFVDILSERVGKCDALIAVIGKHWTSSVDDENRRRLDDPNDFVRVEIAAALERKVPVIPVLVDGATMPQAVDLPDALKNLTRRQAIQISLTSFEADAKRLTDALAKIEEEQSGMSRRPLQGPPGPRPLCRGKRPLCRQRRLARESALGCSISCSRLSPSWQEALGLSRAEEKGRATSG